MGLLHHLFDMAKPEEQGSFCTTDDESEHVQNMSAIDAEIAARTAENIDEAKVIRWDGDDDLDTRYNRVIYEQENDFNPDDDFKQAKYRPGR